jgi:hypothetical protein
MAAHQGTQPFGELASALVGIDPDDADAGRHQQLHDQLPDQPEPDHQRDVTELWFAPADALHGDRTDGAERGMLWVDAGRNPAVEVLGHPVEL